MSDIVLFEKRGRIGIITLNRPEARNAVNGDVASGVEAALDAIEADDDIWVGIVTANTAGQEKPVFCAGADLKAINSGNAGGLSTKRGGFSRRWAEALSCSISATASCRKRRPSTSPS